MQPTFQLWVHNCQYRNRNNMKIQDNKFPAQITNPIVMISNENDLEELHEKEFKRMIISAFKQLKEYMNIH